MSKNLSRRVIKGSVVVFVLTAASSLTCYIIRSFYSFTLSMESYGLFYAGIGFINMIWAYMDLGFSYPMTYLMPKYIKYKKYFLAWNVFKYGQLVQIGVSLLTAFLLYIFSSTLSSHYFKVPGSEIFVKLLAIYLVVNTFLTSLIHGFMGVQKEGYYASVGSVRALGVLLFSLMFWKTGNSQVNSYMLSMIFAYFLTALVYLFMFNKKFTFLTNHKVVWSKKLLKEMSAYAFPVFLSAMVGSLFTYSDTFYLTLLKGVRYVGVYNVVAPLASVALIVMSPLSGFLLPLISHLAEGEKNKIGILVNKIMEIIPFLGSYFALFLIMFPKSPVRLFFGEKWLGESEYLLIFLSIAGILMLLSNVIGTVVLGIGKVKERLKAGIFVTILSLTINPILILLFGLMGVAATNIIVSVISLYLNIRIVSTDIKVVVPYFQYSKIFLFGLTTFFLTKLIITDSMSIFNYLLTGFLYSIIYFTSGFLLGLYKKELINLLLGERANLGKYNHRIKI